MFAVSLLSISVIRTCTDVPAGILAFTSAIAANVPSIANNAIASVGLK
jgi:hypothetical protein